MGLPRSAAGIHYSSLNIVQEPTQSKMAAPISQVCYKEEHKDY